MSASKIILKKFYDSFTQESGGGVDYLPGNVNDRIKRIIDIDFAWNMINVSIIFDFSAQTAVMENYYDNRNFLTQGFSIGDSIEVTGTIANNKSAVISAISDDGRTITFVDAPAPESCRSTNFYGTTPITEIDYLYNIVPNGSPVTFASLIDPNTEQRFIATGLDASNTSTIINFQVATKSIAWFTETISNSVTNQTADVTIAGLGISGYVQSFRIIQWFTVDPNWLVSQLPNFINRIAPDWYLRGSSLMHIFRVDAKYVSGSVANQSVLDSGANGNGTWFNMAKLGTRGEYYIDSISYIDNDTSEVLIALDLARNCKVQITVKSRSGKFVSAGSDQGSTPFILGFNVCPSVESEYQNTETTYKQNFFQDTAINYVDDENVNGENYGTSRQAITNCSATLVNVNTIIVNFIFTAGSLLKSYWEGKDDGDRNYEINIITQGHLITSTKASDRMTLLADFNSALWNREDTSLFEFVGTGIQAFKYPDISQQPSASIEGFQGDPFYAQLKFRVKQYPGTPAICKAKSVTWVIVCSRTGMQDFVLEQKIINFETAKFLNSIQQILYSDTRGFISYPGDLCNEVSVLRDPSHDIGARGVSAFIANYGLILRYEYWQNALAQYSFGGSDQAVPDIAENINDITQDWSSYNDIESWNLFLRFTISILNTETNATQNYTTQIPLIVNTDDQIIWSGATGALTQVNEYWNSQQTEQIDSILGNSGIVLCRSIMNGSFPLGAGDNYYGQMFATPQGQTIFTRRFASSEIPSESDSPFSAPDADPDADFSWSNGGVRINIFSGVKIVIESYFDTSIYPAEINNIDMRMRIGSYKPISS